MSPRCTQDTRREITRTSSPATEDDRIERVVDGRSRYRVVEKVNRKIASIVRRLNRRSEPPQ